MEKETNTLRELLAGRDPVTGKPLAGKSPYRRPEVVAALERAVAALEAIDERRVVPARSGMPWTPEEERRLTARFEAGETVDAIARRLERSPAAVTARLVQLELIAAPPGFRLRYGPLATADG